MYHTKFNELKIGDKFFFDSKDNSVWIKKSNRSAILKENRRIFYVGLNEVVFINHLYK